MKAVNNLVAFKAMARCYLESHWIQEKQMKHAVMLECHQTPLVTAWVQWFTVADLGGFLGCHGTPLFVRTPNFSYILI